MYNQRLKFRAWLDQEHRMVYQGNDETVESFMHRFANCYLMEFTGLESVTNGYARKIYENDIVRELDSAGLVTDSPVIDVVWENNDDYNGWSIIAGTKYECLGNLYENPDLILTLYRNANQKVCSLAKDMNMALRHILNLDEQLDKNPDLVDTYLQSSQESGELDAQLKKVLLLNNDLLNKTLGLTNMSKIKHKHDSEVTEKYNPDTFIWPDMFQENIDGWNSQGINSPEYDDITTEEECRAWADYCAWPDSCEEEEGDPQDLDILWLEDRNDIASALKKDSKDAVIQLMRNVSDLREENRILREEIEDIRNSPR